MEEEKFFSGYCRQIDQNRMVEGVKEGGELTEIDCSYESCIYNNTCTIGKSITQWLDQQN